MREEKRERERERVSVCVLEKKRERAAAFPYERKMCVACLWKKMRKESGSRVTLN